MFKILLFICFSTSLFSIEELEVFLERKIESKPLFVFPIEKQNSKIPQKYLDEIIEVIRFDIAHLDRILLLSKNPIDAQIAQYEMKLKLSQNLFLIEVIDGLKKIEFPPFSLSQNLDEDRRKIHQTLDAFYQKIFHKKSLLTSKLIYCVRKKDQKKKWVSEIWSSDFDGNNTTCLIQDDNYHLCPHFLPSKNSNDFLYVSYKSGRAKIYSNKSEAPYITLSGNQILPSISRDGSKIAFISDAAGRPDLFLQLKNQKPIQLFSLPRATQATSTFDPEGNRIAFVSDKDGPPKIYLMEIPKKFGKRPNTTLITKQNRENISPSWSSDGTKLAYSAKTEGIRQIWIYDFETKEEWQLTFEGKHKENPSWALDNCHLVYNTEDDSELFLISIKDKKSQKISKGPGEKRFAAWQID